MICSFPKQNHQIIPETLIFYQKSFNSQKHMPSAFFQSYYRPLILSLLLLFLHNRGYMTHISPKHKILIPPNTPNYFVLQKILPSIYPKTKKIPPTPHELSKEYHGHPLSSPNICVYLCSSVVPPLPSRCYWSFNFRK